MNDGMIVSFISHACVKYKSKDITLITDPWITDDPIYSDSIYKLPHTFDDVDTICNDVNWVYISHTHEDHFHIPSLKLFNENVNFIIPDFSFHKQGQRGTVLKDTLIKLGFKNIYSLSPWEQLNLSEEVKVTMIPSAKSRYFDWENSGLSVSYKNKNILNMNDNVADEDLCLDIIDKIGDVDIYFVQSASVTTYPSCFIMPEKEKDKIVASKIENYSYQDIVIDKIKPKILIPYAGDLGWFGGQSKFNYWSRSTPLDLYEYIISKGIESIIFESGDHIYIDQENIKIHSNNRNNWKEYEGVISKNQQYYNKIVRANESRFLSSEIENFSMHLKKYINSINQINKESKARFSSNAIICYKILRQNKEDILIQVRCQEDRYLELEIIHQLPEKVAQIHSIEENLFCEIIKGNFMLSQIVWQAKIEQFYIDEDVKNLIFAMGYHIDGDNRSKELKIRPFYTYN